jgi:hypothetical protein
MPINIKGKEYFTVPERVNAIHADQEKITITTECILHEPVLFKATVITQKGTFNGWSAANPSKPIEKMSPYEVAETSAIGRALGFAGYGVVESIATADEIAKGGYETKRQEEPGLTATCPIHRVTMRQFTKEDREWWSHKLDDGTWCNGKQPKAAPQKPKQEEEYDYSQVTDSIPF